VITATNGAVAPGFEAVADAFDAGFKGRPSMGAALSVWLQGKPVVDLWAGVADERSAERWQAGTASVIFSCTKGLVSILAAQLVERRLLSYDEPVARYWPEFAAAGKGEVTVGQALGHKAGLSATDTDLTLDDIIDWPTVTSRLAAQAPLWPPGGGYAYHALTHGWLAGEILRRVTGKSVGELFATAITRPLGVPAWIGLPDEPPNPVAHLQVAPSLVELWARDAALDSPESPNWIFRSMTLGNALPGALATPEGGFNDRRLQTAEIPGAGGIATAHALAKIWSATVVPTGGILLLRPETVALATRVQTEGPPVFPVPGPYSRWGMGFQLDSQARRYLTEKSFGHDGAGGQVGFADPVWGVGFGYVTNWMEAGPDPRATSIIDALRESLADRQ
jgi:CubicO group peptidase (beta-lactamase class C family)